MSTKKHSALCRPQEIGNVALQANLGDVARDGQRILFLDAARVLKIVLKPTQSFTGSASVFYAKLLTAFLPRLRK